MTGRRTIPKRTPTLLGVGLLAIAILVCGAVAFTVEGGTAAQRAQVKQVLATCTVPDLGHRSGVAQPRSGQGDPVAHGRRHRLLRVGPDVRELEAHRRQLQRDRRSRCGHQIWYTLGPKWWAKWADICNGARSTTWTRDFYENFAECAKVTFFSTDLLSRPYPVTGLLVTSPADVELGDRGPIRQQVPVRRSTADGHADHRFTG